MTLLHLEPMPNRVRKGDILRFVCEVGGLKSAQVGKIDVQGNQAILEVPDGVGSRLVKAFDGAAFQERPLRAWTTGEQRIATDGDEHFARLARLLNLEAAAEAQRILEEAARGDERTGDCLTGLVALEESSGLGGRFLLSLGKRNRTQQLPWNRLEPGTPVLLSAQEGKRGEGWRGVVCERTRMDLCVALNEPPGEERPAAYRLDLAPDEAARQRQLAALERARGADRDRLAELRRVLLGVTTPQFRPETVLVPLDATLNDSQKDAVQFALSADDFAIIHGPPGTGKTTAVVEVIRQALRRGQKVLACAPSNLGVDNMLERLLAQGEKAVRLGHPARVLPVLREHTLDLLVEDHDDTRQARKLAKKAFSLFRQAGKWTRGKPEPGARQELRQEARNLLADGRRLEAQAVQRVLDGATVLCATLTGLDSELLGQRQFDLVVIDEAAQSTEPVCWLPLLRSRALVLAGDHCQLPPTILSKEAAEQGFAISLMERLVAHYGPTVTRRLDVQYRMHEAIMTFSSQQFYEGALEAHPRVSEHLLADLPNVVASPLTLTPVEFIDTAGAGYDEEVEPNGTSKFNPQEADLAVQKVHALLAAGIAPEAVAVIAPYAAQVRMLRDKLTGSGVDIDSVDGFQGREKEAVVLTLVRSNPEGEVGFLADIRRINVALTRARRKLIVIGDSATLCNHAFYAALLEYFESRGAYRSVWEETRI